VCNEMPDQSGLDGTMIVISCITATCGNLYNIERHSIVINTSVARETPGHSYLEDSPYRQVQLPQRRHRVR
jgi:hypothetical protein